MGIKRLFLDMDGVLVDLLGGICQRLGRDRDELFPPGKRSPYGISRALGLKDLDTKALDLWHSLDRDFWAEMKPTEEAYKLAQLARDYFGNNVYVLTLVVPSFVGADVPSGKIDWLERYFPEFVDKTIITPDKSLCAHDSMLIDDKDENVTAFADAGGISIQFPRLWNAKWRRAKDPLVFLENYLISLKPMIES